MLSALGAIPPTQVAGALHKPVAAEVIVTGENSSTEKLSIHILLVDHVFVISIPNLAPAILKAAGTGTLMLCQGEPVASDVIDEAFGETEAIGLQVIPPSSDATTLRFTRVLPFPLKY